MTEFELMITFTIISKAVTKNDEILKFTMRTRYSTKNSCISISQHCMLKATFFYGSTCTLAEIFRKKTYTGSFKYHTNSLPQLTKCSFKKNTFHYYIYDSSCLSVILFFNTFDHPHLKLFNTLIHLPLSYQCTLSVEHTIITNYTTKMMYETTNTR